MKSAKAIKLSKGQQFSKYYKMIKWMLDRFRKNKWVKLSRGENNGVIN